MNSCCVHSFRKSFADELFIMSIREWNYFSEFYDLQPYYYDTFLVGDCRAHVRNLYNVSLLNFKKYHVCCSRVEGTID